MLISYVLPVYGEQTLDNITYDFMETQCNLLLTSGGKKGCGLSAKTVTDVLSIIRNILKYASKRGL